MKLQDKLTLAGYAQHVKNIAQGEDVRAIYRNKELLIVVAGTSSTTLWEFEFEKYRQGCSILSQPGFKTSMQRFLAWKTCG